jgi:hypothetical protein
VFTMLACGILDTRQWGATEFDSAFEEVVE